MLFCFGKIVKMHFGDTQINIFLFQDTISTLSVDGVIFYFCLCFIFSIANQNNSLKGLG